ncbi:MAG: type II secretion system F family protein [Microbacteriaceae bacterium]
MSELSIVASTAHRLAVLLAAGVSPSVAWTYLDSGANAVVDQVAVAATGGTPVVDAILGVTTTVTPAGGASGAAARKVRAKALVNRVAREHSAWRALAACWCVASEAGAPLAATLRHMAASLRSLADAQRDMQTALAAPVATAKIVMALPLVGVLFAIVLGFDPLATLFTNPLGVGCLVGGVVLLAAGRSWNRSLIEAAQPTLVSPGLWCELTAIAVSGGAALDRARQCVDAAATACGIPVSQAEADLVARTVQLSQRAGVPAGELLRAEAEEQRRQARADAATRAATLSVRLMIPLGVCVLPAFMLLGVAPLLISVVSSTVRGV